MTALRAAAPARFWAQVDKSGECWLWTGTKSKGYGHLTYLARSVKAHRIAWELTHGLLPAGLELCHNCPGGDNKRCCNPAHLFLGTHAMNMHDWEQKGRSGYRGERIKFAKLTEAAVREMAALSDQGVDLKEIARRFGVSETTAWRIARRATWKHLFPSPT